MNVQHHEGNGRLSLVTECNGILHLTGRTCMPAGPGVTEQTAGVLQIIDETLAKYGSDKEHIRDFDAMNAVWESWVVPGHEPARATVQAKMAKEEAMVEIVVTAVRKDI